MMWSKLLGLLAVIGATQAIPQNMKSAACATYYSGTCMPGACETGQKDLGMQCSDGGSCCHGEPDAKPNPRLIDVCGRLMVSSRIIGGESFEQCTVPYNSLVALKFFFSSDIGNQGNLTFCAGSLIDDDLVVTTANCVNPLTQPAAAHLLSDVRVVVGEYDAYRTDYGNDGAPEDRVKIREIKLHPNFDSNGLSHNIALLRLDRKITYNNCKIPACLPDRIENAACGQVQNECQMVGLGARYTDDLRPFPRPSKADVRVFDQTTSQAIFRYSDAAYVPEGSVIVEPIQAQQKACVFDWGGLVVCPKDGHWELSGLISFHNCLQNGNQPIFAVDMTYYRSWIESCMENFTNCSF